MNLRGFARVDVREQEVTFTLDRMTGKCSVCSTWPQFSVRIERKHGKPEKVTKRDGKITASFWTIENRLLSLRTAGSRAKGVESDQYHGKPHRKAPVKDGRALNGGLQASKKV